MQISTPTLENPLDSAISELGDICNDRELIKSSIDAGTMKRMLVHITNINLSVLASTEDHVNGAKRLNDFALTLTRIARNSDPPNDVLTSRMSSIADNLRAASEKLARSDAIPNWRTPAHAPEL
jgi:hypothetical protein